MADGTWTNATGDDDWTTAGNWTGGVPGDGDVATFDGSEEDRGWPTAGRPVAGTIHLVFAGPYEADEEISDVLDGAAIGNVTINQASAWLVCTPAITGNLTVSAVGMIVMNGAIGGDVSINCLSGNLQCKDTIAGGFSSSGTGESVFIYKNIGGACTITATNSYIYIKGSLTITGAVVVGGTSHLEVSDGLTLTTLDTFALDGGRILTGGSNATIDLASILTGSGTVVWTGLTIEGGINATAITHSGTGTLTCDQAGDLELGGDATGLAVSTTGLVGTISCQRNEVIKALDLVAGTLALNGKIITCETLTRAGGEISGTGAFILANPIVGTGGTWSFTGHLVVAGKPTLPPICDQIEAAQVWPPSAIGAVLVRSFSTRDAITGVLTDADALPTGLLYVNDAPSALVVTVANVGTGQYTATVTLTGLTNADRCELHIVATVAGVTMGLARQFVIDATVMSRATQASVDALPASIWNRLTGALTTAGSIGAWLLARIGAIKAKTDTIGAADLTAVSPVLEDGDLEIVQGDDYMDADGRALEWTDTAYTGPIQDGDDAEFALMETADYHAAGGTAALTKAGTAHLVGTTLRIVVELTAAETAALEPSPPDDRMNYTYQVRVDVGSSGSGERQVTAALGSATVKKKVVA